MTYKTSFAGLRPLLCTAALALALAALGCGSSGDSTGTGGSIDAGGSISGCVAAVFPAEQPAMLNEPRFEQDVVLPGQDIIVELDVDQDTREARIELRDVWNRDNPPIGLVTEPTSGGTTLTLTFPTELDTRGRYFLHVTLCADDCDASGVLYTLAPEIDDPSNNPLNLPINRPYQRIAFEGDAEISNESTCLDVSSVVIQ